MTIPSISLRDRATWRDLFIGLVLLAAVGMSIEWVRHSINEPTNIFGVLILFLAMLVAERLSVPLPREAHVSVSTIPHIVAALLLPTWVAVGAAGAAMFVDQLSRARIRKVLFNTASVVLTVGMTASVAHSVGLAREVLGRTGEWQQSLAFLVVAATYYAMTNLLPATVIALDRGASIGRILLDNARFTLPAEFAVCGLGGLVAVLWVVSPAWAPLLLFPGIIAQVALAYVSSSKRSAARLAFLAEASRRLALSLEQSELPMCVAELAVPMLADTCLVYMANADGSFVVAAVAGTNQARLTHASASELPSWARRTLETHRGVLDGRFRMAAPIEAADRCLGVLVFLSGESGRRYDGADLTLIEDVAKRCAVSLENARLHAEAQNATRLRDEFLSVAAHELKTPVTSLLGYSQLLQRLLAANELPEPAVLARALQTVDAQSTKLAQLTAQLLDVSRIEAGKLQLQPKEFDLSQLIRDVAAAAQSATHLHTLRISLPEHCLVFADPLRLEQVASNLISNAIKYSPAGGIVDIVLRSVELATIVFEVRDHGIGIPPQRREHLFDRFYQAHGEGYFGGLGLGLYISRQIVELHGGSITADFPPDGGTRFTVDLPIGAEYLRAERTPQQNPTESRPGTTAAAIQPKVSKNFCIAGT